MFVSTGLKQVHHLPTGFTQAHERDVAGGRHCCCFTDEKTRDGRREVK